MRAAAIMTVLCLFAVAITGCDKKSANTAFAPAGNKVGEGQPLADAAKPATTPTASRTEAATTAPDKTARTLDDRAGDKVSSGGVPPPGSKEIASSSDSIAKEKGKDTPPPAVADPVVGRETMKKPRKDELPSGILTAGSFDDNVDPLFFSRYVKRMSQHRGLGDLPAKLQGQRLMVFVKDASENPVGNARVKLSDGAGAPVELMTRSDGRAVFVLPFDQLPEDKPLKASVTGPNGGAAVNDTIPVGSSRWEVTLPSAQGRLPKNLELAIVLDTTGSMGDELRHLKAEIRGISAAISKKFPEVRQRFALVCYRDEGQGDEYVTRVFDFTESLDVFHKNLSAQSAAGGGDYPEAVHRGLEAAVQLRWKDDPDTARLLFLIADAPPHAQHMNRTLAHADVLRKKGTAIYPIACSGYDEACEFVMRSCALLTGSRFLFLTDDSGVGGSHAEPTIPYYQVERLEKLMIRTIASELSGRQISANPADIIRTVGKKVN